MIIVAIADDHRVVRVGLEQLLGTFDDVELVGAAAGGEEAVALCAAERPDVLLLDLAMPDLDGIAVTRRRRRPRPPRRGSSCSRRSATGMASWPRSTPAPSATC